MNNQFKSIERRTVHIGGEHPERCHSFRTFDTVEDAIAFMWAARSFAEPQVCCMLRGLDGYVNNGSMSGTPPANLEARVRHYVEEDTEVCRDLALAFAAPVNKLARPGDVANLVMQRDKLLAQRDELLAATRNLRDVKGRHHSEQAFNRLMEVLAKVEAAK